jgi:hypothetical protein
MSTPPIQHDHIQDLHNLLQGMSLSGGCFIRLKLNTFTLIIDSSFDTVAWSRKTTEESITLSKSSLRQSTPAKKPAPTLYSASAHLNRLNHPPSTAISSHPQPQTVAQTLCQVTVPMPSDIHPPQAGETPEGFWVITVGQEVGVFYRW